MEGKKQIKGKSKQEIEKLTYNYKLQLGFVES